MWGRRLDIGLLEATLAERRRRRQRQLQAEGVVSLFLELVPCQQCVDAYKVNLAKDSAGLADNSAVKKTAL